METAQIVVNKLKDGVVVRQMSVSALHVYMQITRSVESALSKLGQTGLIAQNLGVSKSWILLVWNVVRVLTIVSTAYQDRKWSCPWMRCSGHVSADTGRHNTDE